MNSGIARQSMFSYVIAWIVLLLLLGASIVAAYMPIGVFHLVTAFGIAATQAAIIFIVFMRLRGRPSLKWVFAGAGFFWLIFLYGLSLTDYWTRTIVPPQ